MLRLDWNLVFTVINLLILYVLMRKFLFKPVNEILEKRGAQGEQCGMDSEFMKKIFEAIHEESVRQQMEIINK